MGITCWIDVERGSNEPPHPSSRPSPLNIQRYPGNRTALHASERPYKNFSAVMTGINPVPGPRMGKENGLYLRYFLKGGTTAPFQHFSLTREDNWHIVVNGLTQGQWAEVALNFTRDAVRNNGDCFSLWKEKARPRRRCSSTRSCCLTLEETRYE